jgi:MFS family permease
MPEAAPGKSADEARDKAAAGLSTGTLVALVAGQLGVHAAMAGLRLAAPLQALNAGYNAWAVGLLLALFAGAAVISAMHAGRMADRHGYHRPMRWAVALTLLAMLLALLSAYVPEPWAFVLLCAAAAGTGMGTNTGMLTIQRTAGHAAAGPTERVRIFSWLGVAPSFSNVVGPVAAGLMIDWAGFGAAYALLLTLPLITLAMARLVPRQPSWQGEVREDRASWDLLRLPGFRRLLLVNGLLAMCWDVHTFAVPVLGHERGFSAGTIGLILGTFTAAVTVVRLLIPALAHRLRATSVVRGAMLGCGAVFLLYPLAPSPGWMALCAVGLGLALGSVQPMVMSLLHEVTPDARHGEALALRSMIINASSTLLPLLFGASGALVGAAVLFWAAGGAVGAGSVLARKLEPP